MIRRSHPSPNATFLITQVAASRTSHYRLYIDLNTNIYILKIITATYYEITRPQESQSNGDLLSQLHTSLSEHISTKAIAQITLQIARILFH